MNKISNINLGGSPFVIDEDAYQALDSYLKTIHRHFRSSEGYEEITTDIEARMAELFQERLGTRPIITSKDVEAVIAIMGTPEDFGAEPLEGQPAAGGSDPKSDRKWKLKTGKRLFRNPDEEVIGGVCSGVAAYFGIQDPLWVRIAFILLVFSGGFSVAVYLILWAILPKAESASDRLAMRGEPINVSNIGKIIEEEFEHVSQKVSEIGDELKAEFGTKKKNGGQGHGSEGGGTGPNGAHQFRAAASEGILVVGKVIRTIIDVLVKIIRPIAFVIGVMLVVMLALVWVGAVGGLFWGLPFSSFLHPSSTFLSSLGVFNLLIFIGVPLLMLALGVMRIFMRTHFKPRWSLGLWIFWSLNLISLMFVGVSTVKEFAIGGDVGMGAESGFANTADTLFIEIAKNPYHDAAIMRLGDEIFITGDQLVSSNIRLNIEKSKNAQFEIVRNHFARGSTVEEGKQLANGVDCQYLIEGNKLIVPSTFAIPKGTKWRGQRVNLTLKVPEGKWVKFVGGDTPFRMLDIQVDENFKFPWWHDNYAWKMGPNGMTCPDFIQENTKNFDDLKDFTKIRVSGNVKVRIERGDQFSVRLLSEDRNSAEEQVDFERNGTRLEVSADQNAYGQHTVEITLPSLEELELEGTNEVIVRDFKQGQFRLTADESGKITAELEADSLLLDLTNRSELELRGKGRFLQASVDLECVLDASRYEAKLGDVKMEDGAGVTVFVTDTLLQRLEDGAAIKLDKQPSVVIER